MEETSMFTKTELEVMAKLLDLASDEFSNHGSNDFELPNTPQNTDLIKRVDKGDDEDDWEPPIYHGNLIGNDSSLMDYFKRRCEEEAKKL